MLKNCLVPSLFSVAVFVSAIRDTPKPSPFWRTSEIDFPFMVSLQAPLYYGMVRHVCGGVIISPHYALTSADCFIGSQWGSNRLISGSADLTFGGSLHLIIQKYIHEDYEDGHLDNNIALIKVSPPFDISKSQVNAVALTTKSFPPGSWLVSAGWGATEKPRPDYMYPTSLQRYTFKTVSNQYCNDYDINVTDKQICTQTRVGEGLCGRDEGGPLVSVFGWDAPTTVTKLVGIATKKHSCGNGFPDVYTKVSAFIPWINKTCGCLPAL